MKKLRIAFGRFMHETNSFSSVDTYQADFERTHFIESQDLLKACQKGEWEVKGFLKNLELSGFVKAVDDFKEDYEIELVPLFSAWSISGGPLAKSFFDSICEKLEEQLKQAGDLDGVCFSLHGALGVREEVDPEAKLLQKIKAIIGEDKPISVTFDLHGNLTYEKVRVLDLLCAYRSNPHWDMYRTGYRAGKLLVQTLQKKITPYTTWRSLPMLLGGGTTIDFFPPMRGVFKRLKELEQIPGVLSASLFMVHAYLDHPDLGWSVYIVTDNKPELAEALADEMARRCWAVRKKLPPKMMEPEEMLEKVRKAKIARKLGSIAVCDASDVVGAGGTGENTNLLKFLLEKATDVQSLVPLRDPEAVLALWDTPLGEEVTITVGGKLQPEINPPLEVSGKLIQKKATDSFGKVILLDLNSVKLVITEGYALPMKPSFYEDMGLNTFKADIVVVKNFFHFRIYYFFKSRKNLYVKTKGITDFDRIKDIKTNDPCYPVSEVKDWRPTDKKRRKVLDSLLPAKVFKLENTTNKEWLYTLIGIASIFIISVLLNKRKKK